MTVHDAVSPFAGSPISTRGGLIPDGMIPSGYTQRSIRDATVVAHGSTMEFFEEMLREKPTLHQWASRQPGVRTMRGRKPAYAVALPDSDVDVVVRHSAHGGMFASITKDLFVTPRAATELRISWTLRHVGISTPRILGYALYPTMAGQLWRADVVTREVVGSADLARVLSRHATAFNQEQSIDAAVTLLRRLARTWAYHPDLNLKNVLIAPAGNDELAAYVLDVDTLRFAEKNAEWMNVRRLLRSARKLFAKHGDPGVATLIKRLGG